MGRFEVLRVFRQGRISGWGLDPGGVLVLRVFRILVPNTQSPSPYDIEDIRYIRGVLYAL